MDILFLQKTISEEFKNLATELAKDRRNHVTFLTCDETTSLSNIKKMTFKPHREGSKHAHEYLKEYEQAVILAETATGEAVKANRAGEINPDGILTQASSGIGIIMREAFPKAKIITYLEWFNRATDSVYDFGDNFIDEEVKAKIKCDNTQYLIDLEDCDVAIAPSKWVKDLFPKEYQYKIHVLHEGINTSLFKPDPEAKFLVEDTGIELTNDDEVLTFSTKGMGPLTGFPQFVEIVGKLFNKRPDLHFVIAENEPERDLAIERDNYTPMQFENMSVDKNRIHFVETLSEQDYAKMLQVSSAHVYLSYPLMFSSSCLKALSSGCCVIASDTKPVKEIIENDKNGLLADFWDIDEVVEKIEYALDNKDKTALVRNNARQTVLDNFSKSSVIAEKIGFIKNLIKK